MMEKEDNTVEVTIEKLKDLSLNPVSAETNNTGTCKLDEPSSILATDSGCLAGYVRAVMRSTVVIQSAPGCRIVDAGTAVYNHGTTGAVREIGLITDLFGSVSEPMYTMELHQEFAGDSVVMDAPVYFLLDDPRTKLITVECDDQGRFKVIQN